MPQPSFIVCHIGAREHYSMARTLHRAGMLTELITDLWVPPTSLLASLPGRRGEQLRGRFHPDLADAKVKHFTPAALMRETAAVFLQSQDKWQLTINRNDWFDLNVVRYLQNTLRSQKQQIILSFSYAARRTLEYAQTVGAKTLLSQIDGGEADEALVAARWAAEGISMSSRAPTKYWESWRAECNHADQIIVNSGWARDLLLRAGLKKTDNGNKIIEVPIPYIPPVTDTEKKYTTVEKYSSSRPLSILFLGALTLRKGILETLRAASSLTDLHIKFTLVGRDSEGWCTQHQSSNIEVHDAVPRSKVQQFYEKADIFLFPTHSDGFGMTQIEATGAGLPVIASQNCASIVIHGFNGLLLNEVTTEEIIEAVKYCYFHPLRVAEMSRAAGLRARYLQENNSSILLDSLMKFAFSEEKNEY